MRVGGALIDIVMPTYNNRDELAVSLEALGAITPNEFRLLVCVDGSTDGTREFLKGTTFPFDLRALEHDDRLNHGRSVTRNLALPFLAAEFVLLLDSDMRLAPGALGVHLTLLGSRDCVSVGNVVYLNERDNLWARYLGSRGKNKFSAGAIVRPLDFVTANSAMRTQHLLAVGGFDETLTGYGGEDTELALRLAKRGLSFVFSAEARAVTKELKSADEGLRELHRFAATNLRTIRARNPGPPAPFQIDRLESRRMRDRLVRLLLNPVTDRLVDLFLHRVPWVLQRQLLNYKVIRTVFRGYAEGSR